MSDDALFPIPVPASPARHCAWCDASPTEDFELEPDRFGREAVTGAWVLKRRAIVAQACRRCAQRMAPSGDGGVVR